MEFHFRLHGHKHAFQAPSTLERDAWLERIEAVAAEAKTQAEGIKNSAGYKENVEQIGMPGCEHRLLIDTEDETEIWQANWPLSRPPRPRLPPHRERAPTRPPRA